MKLKRRGITQKKTYNNKEFVLIRIRMPMKMEKTECSETSAYEIQNTGELPRRKHTTTKNLF
jgi:predicted DNA-binding transcriptional regulator AlpA